MRENDSRDAQSGLGSSGRILGTLGVQTARPRPPVLSSEASVNDPLNVTAERDANVHHTRAMCAIADLDNSVGRLIECLAPVLTYGALTEKAKLLPEMMVPSPAARTMVGASFASLAERAEQIKGRVDDAIRELGI